MKRSARPPASIWRARTELAAKESLTWAREAAVQDADSSPSTLVNEAAANTSMGGSAFSRACAPGASAHPHMNKMTRIVRRGRVNMRGSGHGSTLYTEE